MDNHPDDCGLGSCPHCEAMYEKEMKQQVAEKFANLKTVPEHGTVTIVDKEETDRRMKEFEEALKPLQEQFAKDEAKRQEEIKNHPDNGKSGWWIVDGIRHSGHAKASTAQEAIDKCLKAGVVGDWECLRARFWTVELPEVF